MKNQKTKAKKKKMKPWKKILLFILLVLVIFIGWFIYKTERNGGGLSGMLATLVGHDENTRKNLGEFRCLILGISTDQDGVDLTDTIMVASYNPATQKATLLSIPRDTYTGKNPANATAYEKINALYSRKHRADETLEAVNNITGLEIKYYIVVKTEALIKLVDAIGGITFNVPIDMNYDDTSQDLHIHLKAGEQLLDGDKAEQLVRYRHDNADKNGNMKSYPEEYGDNDVGRMRTQREFIMQTMKQTLKPDNIWKINEILDIAKEYVITNVNFDVAKDYVPYAVEFNTENLLTDVLPGTNTNKNSSGTWIFVHDKQKTKTLVQELFHNRDQENSEDVNQSNNVTTNTQTSKNSVGSNNKINNNTISNTTSNMKTDKVKIQLVNATGDRNKLEIAEHELDSLGYDLTIVQSNEIDNTIIINQKEISDDEMQGIKDNLQVGELKNNQDSNSKYDIKIVLGKDYE